MMLRRIHPRYAEILSKRFGLEDAPLTLDQIARHMGITRERVRQLEAKALNKIRGGPLAQMLEEYV
jgi:RNA polymerase primary sigma factor